MLTYLTRSRYQDRRLMALEIDAAQLLQFFRELGRGHVTQTEGLPEDARVVAVGTKEGTLSLLLYIESESFFPLPEGCAPASFNDLVLHISTPPTELWEQMLEACGVKAVS